MEPKIGRQHDLPRRLGMLDATAIVIGIVIGSGIFLLPNLIARNLPSRAAILAAWMVSGVLSFFGALAYAELGAWLEADYGWSRLDAYQLMTQAGELYVGNMVDTTYSLVASISKQYVKRM